MATATFQKFNAFTEALAEKVHNLQNDQLVLLLTNTAPTASGSSVTSDITQITYTNCSSRNLTVTSSAQTGGVYKLVIANTTLTATGGAVGPFRYVVVANSTPASGNLIGFYDYGTALTLNDGDSLNVNFDQTNGVLTLT
jgi:hypothetical protein